MPAYLWLPEGGSGPGLVLLQEIFGVSGYIQRRGADLAAAGYVVLAPELYWRLDAMVVDESAPSAIDDAMGLAGRLDWGTAVGDAVAALQHLRGRDEVRGGTGLVGFCLGGGLAFNVAAVDSPDVLVSYYGSSIPDLLHLAPQVSVPEPASLRPRRRVHRPGNGRADPQSRDCRRSAHRVRGLRGRQPRLRQRRLHAPPSRGVRACLAADTRLPRPDATDSARVSPTSHAARRRSLI